MATIKHPTSGSIRGIWLLDQNALKELDAIIDDYEALITQANKEDISVTFLEINRKTKEGNKSKLSEDEEAALDERLEAEMANRYPFSTNVRTVEVTFASGKRTSAAKFADLFAGPEIAGETPRSFKVRCTKGNHGIEIVLLGSSPNEIDIRASPKNRPEAEGIYERVTSWFESVAQPKLQHLWWSSHPLCYILAFFIAFASLVGYFVWESSQPSAKGRIKSEGRKLLEGGLKPEDEHKAIELMLSLDADYAPPQTKYDPLFPRWWIVSVGGLIILCLLLSWPPRTMISVGKGRAVVTQTRKRIAIVVYILIPVLIVGVGITLFTTYLSDFLGG
jgi:hypothetical protein